MTVFRFYWTRQGGHVHVTVRAGTKDQAEGGHLAKCGDLIFGVDDWETFMGAIGVPGGAVDVHSGYADATIEFKEARARG